jgi:multiple sugar transport system permease protein
MKYHSRQAGEVLLNRVSLLGVIVIAFIAMFPLWWIFRSSLMTTAELYAWPPPLVPRVWRFSNYSLMLQSFPFWRYLLNTLTVVVPSVIFGTSTATLCGYAFARLRFPGKKFLFSLCVGSMLLPIMVTLIPLFVMWTRFFRLGDTYYPLILPYLCGGGAFSIFLLRQFIRTVPREMDEAAFIDGAGYMTILLRIIVPMIKPAMIVVALLLFIGIWNDLLQQSIYLNSMEKYTLSIGLLMFRGAFSANWALLMCATCVSFLPGLVFYLIGQKYFVEGIALTGMKN